MLLAIDIGNSNVVAGVFAGDSLVGRVRLQTSQLQSLDQCAAALRALFASDQVDTCSPRGVVISTVVPGVLTLVVEASRRFLELEPLVVSPDLDYILDVEYSPRSSLGTDRIANAIAGAHAYGSPIIVVDFGTATKLEAVSAKGAYAGGAIAPGLGVSAQSLYARTAQLPPVELQPPASAIGSTTVAGLQSGIVLGHVELVNGLVRRFRDELGEEAPVISTGGLAETVAPLTAVAQRIDTDLTLLGLRLLYERNRPHAHG